MDTSTRIVKICDRNAYKSMTCFGFYSLPCVDLVLKSYVPYGELISLCDFSKT